MFQSSHVTLPPHSTALYTQQTLKKTKQNQKTRPGGDSETPHVQKNLSVPQDAQRKSPPGDPGHVQSDLLPYNMDQTLLQEIACFSASSLPPPPPVQIDFVLPVFSVLDKESKSNMLSMESCQKNRVAFKNITCLKFPTAVRSRLPSRHCIMLIIC